MKTRVIVVEDIPENRSTYEIALRVDGHAVDVAGSKGEALELLRGRTYHAALLDIRLQEGNERNEEGLDVLRSIHESGEGTTAVILSGQGTLATAVDAYEKYGLYRFLRKESKEASVEGIQAAVRAAVQKATLDLFGRYGSLTAVLAGARDEKLFWEDKALRILEPGGMNGLDRALREALGTLLPVLPRRDEHTSRFDDNNRHLELSLWSKAEAKAIRATFRNTGGPLRAAERGGARGAELSASVVDDLDSHRGDFIESIWK
jgi:ActR/RegA family two-component response regulator